MIAHLRAYLVVLIELLIAISSLNDGNFRVLYYMKYIFTIVAAGLTTFLILLISIHIVLVALTMVSCSTMTRMLMRLHHAFT